MSKKAIIIGAGPAGLTAAYELLKRTDIIPIVLEKTGDIGGISKTVNYKGNRIDIGGHRFFSKSDCVMNWWLNIFPLEKTSKESVTINYQSRSREIKTTDLNIPSDSEDGSDSDKVMLLRKRLSRIYFLRKFFTYPIGLSLDTLRKLGLKRTISIVFSYFKARLFPRKPERSLEDFIINRFGSTLYNLFFKDYTQKVWGVPCQKIPAEWGAQRIKGVSIAKAIRHALQSATKRSSSTDIRQKDTETSLIEQFLYPKFGPGQLWEEVAQQIEDMGGKILKYHDVKRIHASQHGGQVAAVAAINSITGDTSYLEGDYFFSTMPVQELIGGMDGPIPEDVKEVAAGLQYRDFITVGILLSKLSFLDKKTGERKPLELKDTWIYIQEKDVKVGRLQLFNNWSPFMVKDSSTVWVGMEFFCNKTDDFWKKSDEAITELAISELEKIGLANKENVLDATVLRMEKTYPAYFGTYNRFDIVRKFINRFENLFLVGRNGMHKYNNSDHSMLTAMVAVDNICMGITEKENIWAINTEQEYHEENTTVTIQKKPPLENKQEPEIAFYDFVFRNRKNKTALWLAAVFSLLQFTVFKILFPHPNFMPDSYSYIEAAFNNADINFWPTGYSKFLRIFREIVHSDIALATFQYLFLQIAVLYFILTIIYFSKTTRITTYVISGSLILIINPVLLSLSNYVSADALFTALSLVWFTELIWLVYRPNGWHALIQGVVLFLAFTIRYNALYYPIVAAGALYASKLTWRMKFTSIGLCLGLIAIFIWQQGNKYRELTGHRQFAAFGGWQLASNALVMYSKMKHDQEKVPAKFTALHQVVRTHIDSLRNLNQSPVSSGIYYLWYGPLRQYSGNTQKVRTGTPNFKKWASVAPLYGEYGRYLIQSHPADYIRYYILPNTISYAVPPVEFLNQYNMRRDSVGDQVKNWFSYKTKHIKFYAKEIKMLNGHSVLAALINVCFIISIIGYFLFNTYKVNRSSISCLKLCTALWVINMLFSILASPVVLRYQVFVLIIILSLTIVLIGQAITVALVESENKTKNKII